MFRINLRVPHSNRSTEEGHGWILNELGISGVWDLVRGVLRPVLPAFFSADNDGDGGECGELARYGPGSLRSRLLKAAVLLKFAKFADARTCCMHSRSAT